MYRLTNIITNIDMLSSPHTQKVGNMLGNTFPTIKTELDVWYLNSEIFFCPKKWLFEIWKLISDPLYETCLRCGPRIRGASDKTTHE